MYATMCFMMVLNVVILKLFISAMGYMPSGPECVPWVIFVVAISRVGKKIDGIILRIGLNPSTTGGGGRSLPGMLTYMIARTAVTKVTGSGGKANTPDANAAQGGTHGGGAHSGNTRGADASGRWARNSTPRGNNASNGSSRTSNTARTSSSQAASDTHSRQTADAAYQSKTANTAQGGAGTQGGAGMPNAAHSAPSPDDTQNAARQSGDHNAQSAPTGIAGTPASQMPESHVQPSRSQALAGNAGGQNGAASRRTTPRDSASPNKQRPGFTLAKKPIDIYVDSPPPRSAAPPGASRPPAAHTSGAAGTGYAGTGAAGMASPGARQTSRPASGTSGGGSAGTAPRGDTNIQQGGLNVSARTSSDISAAQNTERQERYSAVSNISGGASQDIQSKDVSQAPGTAGMAPVKAPGSTSQQQGGAAGTHSRRDSGSSRRTGAPESRHGNPQPAASPPGAAGTPKSPAATPATSSKAQPSPDRHRGNADTPAPNAQAKARPSAAGTAPRESASRPAEARRQTRETRVSGAAGTPATGNISANTPKQAAQYNPKPVSSNTAKPGISPNATRSAPGGAGSAKKPKKRRKRGHR
jgi:hypothetical protein